VFFDESIDPGINSFANLIFQAIFCWDHWKWSFSYTFTKIMHDHIGILAGIIPPTFTISNQASATMWGHVIVHGLVLLGKSSPETMGIFPLNMGLSGFNFPLNQSIDIVYPDWSLSIRRSDLPTGSCSSETTYPSAAPGATGESWLPKSANIGTQKRNYTMYMQSWLLL